MSTKLNPVSREVAAKVVELVNHGLVKGLGSPEPGQMCVEAAVNYAMGLPHGDNPPCVGAAVRSFKITLNDAYWSSNEARAKGMRRVAVAQLGSDGINQQAFAKEVALQTVRQILPPMLRAVAGLEEFALACEVAQTHDVARVARAAGEAAYDAYAGHDINAARAAHVARSAAHAARSAAAYAARPAAAYAASAAVNAASAAVNAASAAVNAGSIDQQDSMLVLAAEIAVQTLIKLDSPGAQWLDLCE